jgi:hypothetical protein
MMEFLVAIAGPHKAYVIEFLCIQTSQSTFCGPAALITADACGQHANGSENKAAIVGTAAENGINFKGHLASPGGHTPRVRRG